METMDETMEIESENIDCDDDDDDDDDENVRTQFIFQPMQEIKNKTNENEKDNILTEDNENIMESNTQSITQTSTDIIAFNTNQLPKGSSLGNLIYCFPTLFPYSTGGYDQNRDKKMSPEVWTLRLLQNHTQRFSQHYGFLPATFDCISTHKAMQSQFISMIVRKPFMDKIGKYTKDDVNACFQYQKLCEKNESLGKSKPINVDEKTKSLLDIIKHIKPGMRAMNCSDESRGRGRNLAFALSKRLGNFNVFATLSPDTAGTYTIGINTFNITETGCKLQLPNILPNRAQRKRFAASDPFQSALYANRLNEVFIDVILGWDQILKGPKKREAYLALYEVIFMVQKHNNQAMFTFIMLLVL